MGFFDQDGSGYDPVTGASFNPPADTSQDSGNPFDNSGSNEPPQSSSNRFSDLFKSLGLGPQDVGNLVRQSGGIGSDANAPPPVPPPSPNGGYGIPGVDAMTPAVAGNAPPPGATPPIPPAGPQGPQTAQMVKPAPAGALTGPGGVGNESNQPMLTSQNGQQVPTFGIPGGQAGARPAPLPPGAGPPMNIQPQAQQGQQSWLQKATTGGTPQNRDLQQVFAGIGKGAANIQGPGRFASAARGFGQGIEGTQEQQKVQMNQATQDFNNHIKLLATGSAVQKNAALASLYQKRELYLQNGSKQSNAWQASDYGRAVNADKQAETWVKNRMISLEKRVNSMSPEEYDKREKEIQAGGEKERQRLYSQYKIDPAKGAEGQFPGNPIDTKSLPGKPFSPEWTKAWEEKVPPGAYYQVPGEPKPRIRPPAQAPSAQTQAALTPQADEAQPQYVAANDATG